ncbi:MAG: putative metal-binding motif-containing protein [Myxococcota bacterium]
MLRLLLLVLSGFAFLGCIRVCETSSDCDDGVFCNGAEQCVAQRCTAGAPPCDDGSECAVDDCNERRQSCTNHGPDRDDDGAFAICPGVPGAGDDCDDANPNRYPGAAEACNGTDEDCDPTTLGGIDDDGDGFVSAACSNPLADGGVARGADCNDAVAGVHPGALEVCNDSDDDCDGDVDDGARVPRYADADNDGWGAGPMLMSCPGAPNTSHLDTDCDDGNPAMHPGEFRCAANGQGTEYELCGTSGSFLKGTCPNSGPCRRQPNGLGVCL